MTTNGAVYIPSMEASQIMEHMKRDRKLKREYVGMIPFSLELMKLEKQKEFKIKTIKKSGKRVSSDIINVEFNSNMKSGEYILKNYQEIEDKLKQYIKKVENGKKLTDKEQEENNDLIEREENLKPTISSIEKEIGMNKWNGMKAVDLRKELYMNGFTIRQVDKETGEIVDTRYVVYKRSSAKSRTGKCLFIKESLKEEMIDWSRMYLPFKENEAVDLASLLAYENLVSSSLESAVTIDPHKILIVDDVDSKFTHAANVVKKNGVFLDSIKDEKATISNSLFDGESLLDSKYFEEEQSMLLLRNHMFKSAAFSTHLQLFFEEYARENDIDYDTWEIKNMYGESVHVKDIEMITTPSSLKALKFADVFVEDGDLKQDKEVWGQFWKENRNEYEKQMFNYWKDLVKKEGDLFGVVKHEKESKRGHDNNGNILNQMSYQMLNSMPLSKEDISDLAKFEINYIKDLKNNDDLFIKYLAESATKMNSNMMFADLYKVNKDIVYTPLFKDFRKKEISRYVTHIKRGKIRLRGDYAVMLGNPMEFLYHAIGQFDINEPGLALKDNEIYTTMFDFNKEVSGFRNPHTSPSNVFVGKNTYNKAIEKYFDLTDNIVCVNAVKFPIQDKLSGCDYDSDTLVMFDSERLLKITKECQRYLVCINAVESQKKEYKLNDKDMYEIDKQLATSTRMIGEVVNTGQLINSIYWDQLSKGKTKEAVAYLMRKVDVMTVLSTICIDLAKKFYELEIEEEVKNVQKSYELNIMEYEKENKKGKLVKRQKRVKPKFFKYVSQSKTIKNRIDYYNCPMDYLYKELRDIPYAERKDTVKFEDLLVKVEFTKANRRQRISVKEEIKEMNNNIKSIFSLNYDEEEQNQRIMDAINFHNTKIGKKKIKSDTMYSMLKDVDNKTGQLKLLNTLYQTHTEMFLAAFKK
ncbi:hypothetical protein [Bacillus badius]|uniref:hypothetical protein n=1 Tax=Bacillus badius TaxID=1455 RepID=UPI00059759E0|nr:hypothetical protein [Bacillus badius]KIL74346.1 Phage related protein YonO [Bacillus badius]